MDISLTTPLDAMNTDSNSQNEHSPIDSSDRRGMPEGDNSNVPKPKRLACMICRKRKLKCDGVKPSCSTCTRLGHSCAYDEVRRKSGPKRGYVKALEERLKQVETLLKTQDPAPVAGEPKALPQRHGNGINQNEKAAATANFNISDPSISIARGSDMDRWQFNAESPPQPGSMEDFNFNGNMAMGSNNVDNNFTWEMIGLGLEEPLPPQETIDELHHIYFEKVHPSMPMIHKYRYLAAMNLAPSQRPPVALRYAMWTQACSITEKFADLRDLFYQRARKYLEQDYIKGYGEHMISVAHAQTHAILACYEFKMMYFPRAWMSTGSAVRLSQMIGLHRIDGAGLDVKQCLPPAKDWTEREERRRTFWMCFSLDRYASIGTGWPMTVDERDVMTQLPSSEEAFDMSRPEETVSLAEAMSPAGASKLSAFGSIVLMACLFGRNLIHLHRPDTDDRDHDLNGEFWKRHRHMDNILLNTSLCLPSQLKLPSGIQDPNIVFTNMSIHTSTICLHQAAIFKADKNRLPASVSAESKVRCITAANEIASIMRMISHMDLSAMNPFISFCLYVAARVFVQYLKSRPDDSQTNDSLRFLLSAMNALKRRNPLTESFLVQLDVDLEALILRNPKLRSLFPRTADNHYAPASNTQGAPCEGGQAPTGIMAYRNDCLYMKVNDDSGDLNGSPDIIHGDAGNIKINTAHSSSTPPTQNQNWLSPDQTLPSRERNGGPGFHGQNAPGSNSAMGTSSGSMSVFGHSESGGSPDGGQSSRPTPNSSAGSEQHHQAANTVPNLAAPSRMNRSGVSSFEASPIMPHQDMTNQQGTSQGQGQEDLTFFAHPPSGAYSMSGTGLTPDQRFTMPETPGGGPDFSMPAGWEMPQSGMTPVGDGVLRSIMQMGPMETMDIGWGQNP